jgi:hypothetical protein
LVWTTGSVRSAASASWQDELHARSAVSIDPAAVQTQLGVLREHAAQMRQHGARFSMAVGGLGF